MSTRYDVTKKKTDLRLRTSNQPASEDALQASASNNSETAAPRVAPEAIINDAEDDNDVNDGDSEYDDLRDG